MAGRWRGNCRESGPAHFGRSVRRIGEPEWRRPCQSGRWEMTRRAMSRLALLLLLFLTAAVGESPRWKFSLEENGLQSFDREVTAAWVNQQGVLFLTRDTVLVYQVNRTATQAVLAQRGASGGAGNFFLAVKVLSAQDGRVIKS